MHHDETDDDDECFYDMSEPSPIVPKPETNQCDSKKNERCFSADELDESFYPIADEPRKKITHAYIDEPLTPNDEIHPNFSYTVLTCNEYMDLMISYVDEVKDTLQLSATIVQHLLHYFKWNKQRLYENFYDMNSEDFFQQTKIINPFASRPVKSNSTNCCLICCSEDESEMFSLECKHTFCEDCWKNYLTNEIVSGGHAQIMTCPDFQCGTFVDEQTITKFLDRNPNAKHIYTKLLLNSYVENNPRARWCPGKNCHHIINATSLTSAYNYAQLITCDHCGTSFCFLCAQPWHDPIKCVLLMEWNKKLLDDIQMIVWLKANTKFCPKCHVSIEKNGGCNHMTCRNCQHEFCWLCFGQWAIHSECNRYNENEQIQTEHALTFSRYFHYYDRFRSHERSLDLESTLLQKTHSNFLGKRCEISKHARQLIDKAFDVLLSCRQMLIYTYAFAYYLIKNNQSIVFEENQADLERACEELSALLEQDYSKEIVWNQIQKQLVDKSRYCHQRKYVLLHHVKEGYNRDYWQYITKK